MAENIKKMFERLAKYNSRTNQKIIKILERMEPDKLTQDFGSFFGSILGILNHLLTADIFWLRGFGKSISSLDFVLPIVDKFPVERKPPKELNWTNLKDFKTIRVEIDTLLEQVVETLPSTQYTSMLKMESFGDFEFDTCEYLLHIFNHHTHHRGGVAVLLDQLKVKNAYSNLLWNG